MISMIMSLMFLFPTLLVMKNLEPFGKCYQTMSELDLLNFYIHALLMDLTLIISIELVNLCATSTNSHC